MFQTQDGWILVQIVGNPLYERWATLMGEEYWLEDSKFSSDESRGENAIEISERMQRWTQDRTNAEVVQTLEDARIPCGEVLAPQQTLENEQVAAMNFLVDTPFPGVEGMAPIARMPMNFSSIDNSVRRRAPLLGEHTDAILAELGYTDREIVALHEARAV